jgi:hypothetical protein
VADRAALEAARAAGRRELAEQLRALIGDRVHLGPASLGGLLAVLDAERDPNVVAADLGMRRG